MNFYDSLSKICEVYNVSLSGLAIKAGLNKSVPTYWKKNPNVKIKKETLEKLATALSLPYLDFLNLLCSYYDDDDIQGEETGTAVQIFPQTLWEIYVEKLYSALQNVNGAGCDLVFRFSLAIAEEMSKDANYSIHRRNTDAVNPQEND